MSALMYRRAFADHHGLVLLTRGIVPDVEEARRRIFVNERAAGSDRPDHFYKNYLAARLGHLTSVAQLPWEVLSALADRFLDRSAGRIVVKGDEHAAWLDLLPHVSPLAISVAFLVKEKAGPPPGTDPRGYLAVEIGDTALLAPAIPELKSLIRRAGLNEMHMHLNGSTELDIIWPDAATQPDLFHEALVDAHGNGGVLTAELYDQIELGLTPATLWRRLRAARRVRREIAAGAKARHEGRSPSTDLAPIESFMDDGSLDADLERTGPLPTSIHPALGIFPSTQPTLLINEAVWLYSALQIAAEPGPWQHRTGLGLYFNFLVMAQVARITVQQTDQVGFDQFQKFTVVGTRDRVEAEYAARFRQLNIAPPHDVLRHLEGRLAPKRTPEDVAKLIAGIVDGYLEFRSCPYRPPRANLLNARAPGCLTGTCGAGCPMTVSGRRDAELSLVVHFIKRSFAPTERAECLDHQLRMNLETESDALVKVLGLFPLVRQVVTGIDAAANEMHAAPEVFARTFWKMRQHGIRHATYHVGEDFAHLVSGIRAIAEALTFLNLGEGDRIGHGTALGVSPRLWMARTGARLMLPLAEQYDNAVFVWDVLSRSGSTRPPPTWLTGEIARLSSEIHGRSISPQIAADAWRMRSVDVLQILQLERRYGLTSGDARAIVEAAKDEAMQALSAGARLDAEMLADSIEAHPEAYRVFRERHRVGAKLKELREVRAAQYDDDELRELQDLTLGDLNAAGIAIETLPSSNVRIGVYRDLTEHHLFRWLGLTGETLRNPPTVCVGSDDTGIFATSLRNEYAAVWDVLVRHMDRNTTEAEAIIEGLNRNGWARRFRP